jgi:hypothetical protein
MMLMKNSAFCGQRLLTVAIFAVTVNVFGCGPNRQQRMAGAAKDQATTTTEGIGTPGPV